MTDEIKERLEKELKEATLNKVKELLIGKRIEGGKLSLDGGLSTFIVAQCYDEYGHRIFDYEPILEKIKNIIKELEELSK